MAGAFNMAVTGMLANQDKMAVIGNNIANSQTIAFKANNMVFTEEFVTHGGQYINGTHEQYGNGVRTGGITSDWGNGAIEDTGQLSNVAISGDGFFPVYYKSETYYTRAGDFTMVTGDSPNEYKLMRPNGATLMGCEGFSTTTGLASGTLGEVVFRNIGAGEDQAPSSYEISPEGVILPRPRMEWANDAQPTAAYNDGTGNFTYAELLNDSTLTQARYDAWVASYQAARIAADPTLTNADIYVPGCTILNNTGVPATTTVQARTWDATTDYYDELVGTSWTTPTSYNAATVGQATGGIRVINGFIGVQRFNNPDSLQRIEAGMYLDTSLTSKTTDTITKPGDNGSGTLVQAALENSNVDLVTEFTDMIVTQRAFQANSKTIKVSDEMLQSVLGLI
jgi:flagellar hook protein FlgE